jgi:hypothetical protein
VKKSFIVIPEGFIGNPVSVPVSMREISELRVGELKKEVGIL